MWVWNVLHRKPGSCSCCKSVETWEWYHDEARVILAQEDLSPGMSKDTDFADFTQLPWCCLIILNVYSNLMMVGNNTTLMEKNSFWTKSPKRKPTNVFPDHYVVVVVFKKLIFSSYVGKSSQLGSIKPMILNIGTTFWDHSLIFANRKDFELCVCVCCMCIVSFMTEVIPTNQLFWQLP